MIEDTVFWILLAVSVAVYIVSSLVVEHNLKKKNNNQQISLIEYGWRLKSLEYDVWKLRDLVASGGQQDADISNAYMSKWKTEALVMGGTSLSGICRYCKRPLRPGELTCDNCGAMTVSAEAVRLWSGK
jgi:hypothetical protein